MVQEGSTVVDTSENLRLIENSKLLRGVPREVIQPLLDKAERIELRPGDRLLSPGKINENVYILLSGRLSVQVTPSTSEIPLAILNPGECVGEMSVLVDGLVSAHVIAIGECELLAIDYSTFWSLIDGSNEVARNMLNILVNRIRMGNEVVADGLMNDEEFIGHGIIDKLTGLYNYHGMRRKFDRLLQRSVVGKQQVCLIMLEVDGKANIDERDVQGSQSLRTIAQTILTFLRPDDHSARIASHKFAVLLSNMTLSGAITTAERLRTVIGQTHIVMPDGRTLPPVTISASVGVALPDDTYGTLVTRVDMALDRAVSLGGNQVVTSE